MQNYKGKEMEDCDPLHIENPLAVSQWDGIVEIGTCFVRVLSTGHSRTWTSSVDNPPSALSAGLQKNRGDLKGRCAGRKEGIDSCLLSQKLNCRFNVLAAKSGEQHLWDNNTHRACWGSLPYYRNSKSGYLLGYKLIVPGHRWAFRQKLIWQMFADWFQDVFHWTLYT